MQFTVILRRALAAQLVLRRDDQWMATIRQPCGMRASTIDSAPTELTGRPRNSPVVSLDDAVHATSPCTRTRTGPRFDGTARAYSMSAFRWCARYSATVSTPPLSRIVAVGSSSASAAALSPRASASWKRVTVETASAESVAAGTRVCAAAPEAVAASRRSVGTTRASGRRRARGAVGAIGMPHDTSRTARARPRAVRRGTEAAPCARVPAPAPLPDLSALAASVDAVLGVEPAPTTIVRSRAGTVARVGLALEPWPGLAAWIDGAALDAVLLHRHWSLRIAELSTDVGVLANHDAFDRRLGFGRSPELAAALGLTLGASIGERDGFPLATLGDGAPRSAAELRAALVAQAADAGAQAYVTGQLRAPARDASVRAGLHVFAVGHRASERWALAQLASGLRAAWPALDVALAPGG